MKSGGLRERLARRMAQSAVTRLGAFRRDEGGAMLFIALVFFVLMLLIGGMAVDLMRHEQVRTELQQTLDRSVLAATNLDQTLDSEAVVRDYFTKAELLGYLKDVRVDEGLNFNKVTASAAAQVPTFVMRLMGIDVLNANVESAAQQEINNVEVVLVLDVSGSMGEPSGSSTKIAKLRKAAANFVDRVLDENGGDRVSIAIVPYNAQVNLGEDLREKYNFTNDHGLNNVECLVVPDAAFAEIGMSRTTPMPMFSQADNRTVDTDELPNSYQSASSYRPSSGSYSCKQTDPANVNMVRLPSSDKTTLMNQVRALQANGKTSITLGMKWGMALIDPSARPMFAELAADGIIQNAYAVRPFDMDDPETLKFIILMTDGEHVEHADVKPPYKVGPSPIYRSIGDGMYSIRFTSGQPNGAGSNQYWTPHKVEGRTTSAEIGKGWSMSPHDSGSGVVQLDWVEVWGELRVSWVAWQLYGRGLGGTRASRRTNSYNEAITAMSSLWKTDAEMDALLQQSCALTKEHKSPTNTDPRIVVFGIAFEAPVSGQAQIRGCSTSDSHYFNVDQADDEDEIDNVFNLIANQIAFLRLTQ